MLLVMLLPPSPLTVNLYIKTPKGYFPQDDTGSDLRAPREASRRHLVRGDGEAAAPGLDIVLADPAVAGVGSSVGASGFNASVNQGRMFISLKPLAERGGRTTQRVIDRLRRELARHPGA